MKKIAIFASGSGSNAENIIQYFAQKPQFCVKSVFCNVPDAYVLERAKKYLEKNSFMTQADYCQLTGLLKSAASRELREWIANPESGIDYKGRVTHKIYILRKP